VLAATDTLKNFLVERVYQSEWMQREAGKAKRIVRALFEIYMESGEAFGAISGTVPGIREAQARLVCDYVAGMTDRFARERYLGFVLPAGVPSFE